GVPALADDEMPEKAPMLRLVVGVKTLRPRPLDDRRPEGVAEIGREPAALQFEHLVPAPRLVEPERRPGGRRRERVLELVPVVERRLGRKDRLERELTQAADATK